MRRAALALLLVLPVVPVASACSLGPPADWSRVAPTGEGAVWGNRGWELGELWLPNGSFRAVVALSPLGGWSLSSDGRWAAIERTAGYDAMCRASGHRLEVVDLHSGVARTLLEEDALAFAASPRHVAVARAGSDAVEVYAWGSSEVVARLRVDVLAFRDAYYGPGWQANRTGLLAFSPDGRLLAAYAGPAHGLAVFDVDAAAPLRPHAPPYGLPSGDDLVALAFRPDGGALAGMTTQGHRFSEVFAWDLAAPHNAVAALRRYPEAGRGLAWTEDGLVGAFQDEGWPPGDARVGVLRRWDDARLGGEAEARWPGEWVSGGLAGRDGLLYAGVGRSLEVLDARTLDAYRTRDRADPDPGPEPRREAPAPALLTVLGILAATRGSRAGRR